MVILIKNDIIISSWSRIEPDRTADERMLDSILARNRSAGQQINRKTLAMHRVNWKYITPVAACLVIAVAIALSTADRNASKCTVNKVKKYTPK